MRNATLVVLALSMSVAGCAGSSGPAKHPQSQISTGSQSSAAASRRYVLVLSPDAKRAADRQGIELGNLAWHALARIGSRLPGGADPTVVVRISTGGRRQTIPEIGLNGFTNPESGAIAITIDPSTKLGLATALHRWLPSTLAHEGQNSARVLHGPGFGQNLLEWMVSEGLADAFSTRAFPATPQLPWANALTGVQERDLWRRARSNLTSDDTKLYDRWFFGGGRIPRWAGYTIGTHIVESFLTRHPEAQITDLSLLPAREILSGGSYHGAAGDF